MLFFHYQVIFFDDGLEVVGGKNNLSSHLLQFIGA